ncbi:MAG: hypothetical protein C0606_01180 [Hyphomicrobiales bacterium]|nr:MAG: hypothetical protein C0606_01180 [Hyphomicrobiales bacterium]
MRYRSGLVEGYSPLYFLASLGAGGMAVSFFMYLMFMVPHKTHPIPTYEDWTAAFASGNLGYQIMIPIVLVAVVFFILLHIRLLIWNIREYRAFAKHPAHDDLSRSNAGIQLMAIPLTLGMTVNAGFIAGALFVPGLWSVVEYMFPAAIIAFVAIGAYAMKLFLAFFTRALTTGHFDCERNNSLAQMLSVFAFSMVGVGLAAPAAMSHIKVVSAIAFFFSVVFLASAVFFGIIKVVMGFRSMMNNGVQIEASPTLWIMIPVLTILGIAFIRLTFALDHNFGAPASTGGLFAMISVIVSLQIIFGLLGYSVMKKVGYFEQYLAGPGRSPGSYALICPGVAGFVMATFFIQFGLVATGVVPKFSIAYFLLHVPLVVLQVKTASLLLRLNRKLLHASASGSIGTAAPAE